MAKSNAEKRAAFNESNGENKGEPPELERSLDEEVGEER